MARIYRRHGSPYWYTDIVGPDGVRRRTPTGTTKRHEAQMVLAERVTQEPTTSKRRVTMERLCRLVIRDYVVRGLHGLKAIRPRAQHVMRLLGTTPWQDVTYEALLGYVEARTREKVAPATINLELSVISRAFALGYRDRLVPGVVKVPWLRPQNAREGFIGAREAQGILRAIQSPTARDLVEILWESGWRLNEVRQLVWQQVDLGTRTVYLPGRQAKNGKPRALPMTERMAAVFAERRTGATSPWVFASEWTKGRCAIGSTTVERQFKQACRGALGLPHTDLIIHDLRRSVVRDLIESGVDQKVAREITGHESNAVFERYRITGLGSQRAAQMKLAAYRVRQCDGTPRHTEPKATS